MPADNPAAYADIAKKYNANPGAVPGWRALLDDLQTFMGMSLGEAPANLVGPPGPQDFPADVRERMARQELLSTGGGVDNSGVQNAEGTLNDLSRLLQRLRGGAPDAQLAERLR